MCPYKRHTEEIWPRLSSEHRLAYMRVKREKDSAALLAMLTLQAALYSTGKQPFFCLAKKDKTCATIYFRVTALDTELLVTLGVR